MNSYDQLAVLRWIRERERLGAEILHDSDVMMALAFTEDQAQSVLLALQARGDIEFKNMVLGRGGSHTLTKIRLRRSGLQRLEEADEREGQGGDSPPEGTASPIRRRSPVRRMIHWFRS
ncbi:MAG TPA: hypothetical protein VM286_07610 [Candidatus Thermoplasmatota archaeon]|nr:hypothetical protein [Candidatus Thermoplasmatota archaeon]